MKFNIYVLYLECMDDLILICKTYCMNADILTFFFVDFMVRSSFQSSRLILSECFNVWSGNPVVHFTSQVELLLVELVLASVKMEPQGPVV